MSPVIEVSDCLRKFDIKFSCLLFFNAVLTLERVNFFSILTYLTLVLSFKRFKVSYLNISIRKFSKINFLLFLSNSEVVEDSSVSTV